MPLAALLALLIFALCEIATRLFFHPGLLDFDTWNELYPTYDSAFSDMPVCFQRGEDMACGPTPYLNIKQDTFPLRKPSGEFRIITIGASVARGDRHSYSSLMERRLHKREEGKRVRVINLAASAIGAERQRVRFEEALGYDPDLVILHVHGTNEERDERERLYAARLHTGLGGLVLYSRFVVVAKKYVVSTFHLVGHTQVEQQTRRSEQIAAKGVGKQHIYRETLHTNVRAMLATAKQLNIPMIVVGRAHLSPPDPEEIEINTFLREAAKEVDATYFDLSGAIDKLSPEDRDKAFKNEAHYSRFGNNYIARKLERVVLDLL